jgi:type I pantothenate kinase
VAARVRRLVGGDRAGAVLVGIAGAVAVGKSTFAGHLRDALAPAAVEVVATDGFLLPNDELAAAGLLSQKGFPATYDVAAMAAFLADVRAGRPGAVPVYDHATYDRVPGAVQRIDGSAVDVVVLEGVNALQPAVAEHLDLRVYLHADEPLVRSWYVERFLAQIVAAEADETSFYRGFVALDDAGRRQLAEQVWTGVNLVNLTDHIVATRDHADVVVEKTAGHATRIRPRGRLGGTGQ